MFFCWQLYSMLVLEKVTHYWAKVFLMNENIALTLIIFSMKLLTCDVLVDKSK